MKAALLSLVALTACGEPLSGAWECSGTTLKVYGDYPLNCDIMRRNVGLARSLLAEHSIVRDDQFATIYGGVPVLVTNLIVLADDGHGGGTLGWYNAPEGITLSYNANALLHEMLHHLDWSRAAPATYFHFGWATNGFNRVADEFERKAQSPSFDAEGPLTKPVEPQGSAQ